MRPTKLQRKSVLIKEFGERNGLFPNDKINRNQQSIALGVSKNTLANWIQGKRPGPNSPLELSKKLHQICKDRNPDVSLHEPEIFLQETGVMRLGQLLGFSRAECRKIIDQTIATVLSTFSIFNTERGAANSLWSDLGGSKGGHYVMYRMEATKMAEEKKEGKRKVMIIPIAVRHLIDGTKKMSSGYKKLRAKAHVYSFTGSSPFFEYDGYITTKDGAGFFHWLFQSRNQTADDLLYIISEDIERVDDKNGKTRLFIIGTLHTRNQDRNAMAGSWPVVIEKVDPIEFLKSKNLDQGDRDEFDDDDSFFMKSAAILVDLGSLDETTKELMSVANNKVEVYKFPM